METLTLQNLGNRQLCKRKIKIKTTGTQLPLRRKLASSLGMQQVQNDIPSDHGI